MLFAATASPAELGLSLADLVSRLQSGPVFHVPVLDDEQKIQALRLRARQRGLELENEPAKYLLNRFPRDLNALFEVLDTLDAQSLVKQRRITIPFIREVFSDKS
jgi:DnaA family protein